MTTTLLYLIKNPLSLLFILALHMSSLSLLSPQDSQVVITINVLFCIVTIFHSLFLWMQLLFYETLQLVIECILFISLVHVLSLFIVFYCDICQESLYLS